MKAAGSSGTFLRRVPQDLNLHMILASTNFKIILTISKTVNMTTKIP
jgi:hypothetical protein